MGRRLHTVLNFNYLSLILHDPVHEVMRLHTLHFAASNAAAGFVLDMTYNLQVTPVALH